MPFTKTGEILHTARAQKTGVAAFCCHNYESIKIVIAAGERCNAPVIVMMYPSLVSHIPLTTFAAIAKDLAAKSTMPVCLHLDHCEDYDFIMEAIKAGFQSVLIDASRYDYSTNVQMTRRVVEAAQPLGADVEAELGFVGAGTDVTHYQDAAKYTDPLLAKQFVTETGVNFLAVAIGNAHGTYTAPPRLEMDRLNEINKMAGIPLVLHGGSGIPDNQLTEAIRCGISKINIGTDYFNALYTSQRDYILSDVENKGIFGIIKAVETAGYTYAEERMRTLRPQNIKK